MAVTTLLCICVCFFTLTGSIELASAGEPFPIVTEPVDVIGDVGQHCSVGLGPQGEPQIVYFDATNRAVKFAERDAGNWHRQPILATGNTAFYYCAISVDRAGEPHVVVGLASGLRYVTRVGPWWSEETVDSLGEVRDCSITLDSLDRPHVSYFKSSYGGRYAWRDSAGWHVEAAVGPTGEGAIGQFSSIQLRSDGVPVVSSCGGSVRNRTENGWTLAGLPDDPCITSLALDAEGWPHVAYQASNGSFVYAWEDSGGWHSETVVAQPCCIFYALSLRLNPDGQPSFAFLQGEAAPWPALASRSADEWTVQTVDSIYSGWCSLALNAQGHPRIAYYAGGIADLRLAEGPKGLDVPPGDIHPDGRRIRVSPNPARTGQRITLSGDSRSSVAATLLVTDVQGRIVARLAALGSSGGSATISIELPPLPPGLFLASLTDNFGMRIAATRIVVLR